MKRFLDFGFLLTYIIKIHAFKIYHSYFFMRSQLLSRVESSLKIV